MGDVADLEVAFGVTRMVAIQGSLAVKFARDERGRRCNLFEVTTWSECKGKKRGRHLCPVEWCDPTGAVLIMPKARPLTPPEVVTMRRHNFSWWDYTPLGPGTPWESKPEDWGVVDGCIVAVDYSMPAL